MIVRHRKHTDAAFFIIVSSNEHPGPVGRQKLSDINQLVVIAAASAVGNGDAAGLPADVIDREKNAEAGRVEHRNRIATRIRDI